MITLNASGGSITFEFSGNSTYLNDGTITVPVNSLALIIDESDMATFRKAASNDIFVSANIAEFGMTKAELESWFKANAVGSTGGGGGVTSGEVQTMIDESISGKVNVSDNIVSAHTFDARSGGLYTTKLKFYGKHFNFNDFHSKKISVYPFSNLEGQLFTSLYLESYNYVSYDAAAYLSGSTSDDYPSSFTSVTWTGDETKMKVEINSEGYLDLIAQGDYWFGQIDSNITQELYINILNDIASGQSASVINDSIVNNLENLGNTINGIQYEINGKLDASAYTPINVDSTLSQTSTNPIQNKSLFNELRVSGASSGETTIVFVNGESTNYPEGVTVIKFEPTQSNTWASYEFYNGGSYLGSIQVSYYGSISVSLFLDGATYTTSGNTVILTVPTTLGINKITQSMGEYSNFTVKVENPPIYTTLKDVVNGKTNQSDFTAYTADTTPKVDAVLGNGVKNPNLYYDITSGITLSSLPISGGDYSYTSIATDASIDANNGVLGVYTTGATHAVIKNYSVISNRININSIPSNIKMYWNLSYTGNTSHFIAVSCTVNDGTNGYCQWDWKNGEYVPNDKYINTAVTLTYDSTNQVVTITPSSSSALTSIIYVRCNRNIAPATALTQDNCKIGLVTIDTNLYKLQEALDNKQDTLIAGDNITISGNVISAEGGGSITVDSALDSSSTNPVENQALYSELRISNGGETETTLRFEIGGGDSANYPEGCTKIKVEVIGSMNESRIYFFNDGQDLGEIEILNNDNISVYNNFNGATYEISGTTVIISYPTITNVTKIQVNTHDSNYIYKAVTTEPPTAVKDQVVANTTALGGLKLQQISQSDYDNLPTKDSSTLYIII